MQLITEEYKKLNAQLHAENKKYGTCGKYYLTDVVGILKDMNSQDVLDYGFGKSTLANNLPFSIKQYDPCVDQFSDEPSPADLVVCTDVLEHIEPEFLDNVFKHLVLLTKKRCYITANTGEAMKKLPDGRNAHLTIKPHDWWENKIKEYFDVITSRHKGYELIAVLKLKESDHSGNV